MFKVVTNKPMTVGEMEEANKRGYVFELKAGNITEIRKEK